MTQLQKMILVGLGGAILVVIVAIPYLALRPAMSEPIPTIPLATVPPSMALLTRTPLCCDVLKSALAEQGLAASIEMDAELARLEIIIDPAQSTIDDQVPAGQIWGVFEAVLEGREAGCAGYGELIVQVGDFRARVAAEDLLAWGSGELDDGAISNRVVLTKQQ